MILKKFVIKYSLLLIVVMLPLYVFGGIPNAGQQSTIIQKKSIENKSLNTEIDLDVESSDKNTINSESGQSIFVSSIIIEASTEIEGVSTDDLIQNYSGKEMTLGELQNLAQLITKRYQESGFFLASAYIPPQEIEDGKVLFRVMVGQYGDLNIKGIDFVHFNPLRINKGDLINLDNLETGLLLLSDIPGINVQSVITPGASVGTSDLNVDITPGKAYNARIETDNYGSKYTGHNRIGASFNLNNPLGFGDVLSLRAISTGSGMNYKRIGYQLPVNNLGSKVGVAYSDMDYTVGEEFASLDAKGSANIKSLFFLQSLVRGRSANLEGQINLDVKDTQDRIDSTSEVTNKSVKVINFGMSGDRRDDFFGGGINNFSLTASLGNLDIESDAAKTTDDSAAKSDGRFIKYFMTVSRLQKLTDKITFMASFSAQRASTNLNSSEKFSGGGPFSVRAYPQGEVLADEVNQLILEGRYSLFDNTQLKFFVDALNTKINHQPWVGANADNYRNLKGFGSELLWVNSSGYSASILYARKIGAEAVTTDKEKNGRFWIQLGKSF